MKTSILILTLLIFDLISAQSAKDTLYFDLDNTYLKYRSFNNDFRFFEPLDTLMPYKGAFVFRIDNTYNATNNKSLLNFKNYIRTRSGKYLTKSKLESKFNISLFYKIHKNKVIILVDSKNSLFYKVSIDSYSLE